MLFRSPLLKLYPERCKLSKSAKTCSARATSRAAPSSSTEFERKLMVMLSPSSSRRTFSSRVPNKVSMFGLRPMLFFIQSLRRAGDSTRQPLRRQNRIVLGDGDHSEWSCPKGKRQPLIKAYPAAEWESMGCAKDRFCAVLRRRRHSARSSPVAQSLNLLSPSG